MEINNEKIKVFLPLNEIFHAGLDFFNKKELDKVFYQKTMN